MSEHRESITIFDSSAYENDILLPKHLDTVGFYDPPIELKSGRPGHWYVNMRNALESVYLKRKLANYVYDFCDLNNLHPDFFLGVPDGATPLGIELNNVLIEKKLLDSKNLPGGMLRSGAKSHGRLGDRYSVGPMPENKHVILVEDVTTTGGSSMEFIIRCQEIGLWVNGLVSCVSRYERRDRGRTVEDVLKRDYSIDYFALTDARSLLPKAVIRDKPSQNLRTQVTEYYKRYGIGPIEFGDLA